MTLATPAGRRTLKERGCAAASRRNRFLCLCLVLLAATLWPELAQAIGCDDVARLKGPVTSVTESWTPVGPGTTTLWATGPTIAIDKDRRTARIVDWYHGVTDCTFDVEGRPVRAVTKELNDNERWQTVKDLEWRYGTRTVTIRDSKSKWSRVLMLNDAGQPVRIDGRTASGTTVTGTYTYRPTEIEILESEQEGDILLGHRRVFDLDGNVLINENTEVSSYEFDTRGNWTIRRTTVEEADSSVAGSLTSRTITYQEP